MFMMLSRMFADRLQVNPIAPVRKTGLHIDHEERALQTGA
jgi:hypothetical protein